MNFKEYAEKHIQNDNKKKDWLMKYLIKIGKYYNATADEINQEFNDILKHNDIDIALNCYSLVVTFIIGGQY